MDASQHRWPSGSAHDELGAVVHGPAIIARSPGIVMAVRCVYAHRSGLELVTALRASGVQAEGAIRRSDGHQSSGQRSSDPWSEPILVITVDAITGTAHPSGGSGTSWTPSHLGESTFSRDQQFWVDRLPSDSVVTLTAAWPEAGLAEGTVKLTLVGLDSLDTAVVPLL